MRYALAAAALAAGAIAVPFNGKRAVVTDIDIVYETTYVTVTAGDEPAPAATTAATTSVDTPKYHYGHKPWSKVWSTSSSTSAYVPPPSSETPAPAPETSSSTYVAPVEPTPSSSAAPVYVAPTTTSEAPAYTAPASSAAPSSSAAAAPASGYGSVNAPDDYAKKVVYHHNLHRANHSAPDLAWDADLASTAATIASSCVYAHDVTTNGGGYGQNIAAGVKPDNVTAIISDLFYNGEVNYFEGLYGQAQPSMDNFEKWGHFSQIVWKGTTHVGCATQDCTQQGLANVGSTVAKYFTVCNYKNPGNYANEYADNVGQCKNLATVNWNAGL